jgi:hypothetical protein
MVLLRLIIRSGEGFLIPDSENSTEVDLSEPDAILRKEWVCGYSVYEGRLHCPTN